jgi:cytochrome b561
MPWLLTGALLIVAYLAQLLLGWRWEWLAVLQANELYKQLTGFALALFFLMQWRLSVARMLAAAPAARVLVLHRDLGAFAPLLLYLHALTIGYAYVQVMSLAFLGLVGLGLVQQPLARSKQAALNRAWLVVHVTLAVLLVFLIGYHAFNAFYYE